MTPGLPHLPPRATVLLRLRKQAVVLHEAIFTRFPAAWSATANVSVEKLAGGAFCHLRPPSANLRTQSCPTCVSPVTQSDEVEEETGSTPTLRWARTSPPEVHAPARFHQPMGVELQQRSFIGKHTVWSLTREISTRRERKLRLLKNRGLARNFLVGRHLFVFFYLSNSVVGEIKFLIYTFAILEINATSWKRKIKGRTGKKGNSDFLWSYEWSDFSYYLFWV